ncbi:flagellar hook protein FlgE [Candidatus Symbiopectobacterium sp. NZEC151]|uniref:flagellar hook protein FlgE n=1 Tax=Candidatus Symbiopectobacterium sp. NZEC151 TaxID=2820470 RepID=UPI0022265189|nr:flagellar hook protein FlgE [Candidatus Symbiopectobacterium sp. NZEC151]MCW2474388.1 flagellar hook protein FlgE [Candidatus Symbiopectobacterium sp. NZEC151]
MSFYQAVSGLNAASKQLDVIGNNIANSSTVGFKSGTIAFADLFAGGTGLGTKVSSTLQDFGDGPLNSSSRALDVAISGNGFFRLQDAAGTVLFSRNGQFTLDGATRNIVNMQGMLLTGYPVVGTPPVVQQGADPVPLTIPETPMAAQQTTVASIVANLNSSDAVKAFDPANRETANYKGSITVYDTLGNPHNIGLYFEKTGPNKWNVNVQDGSVTGSAFTKLELEFTESGALKEQRQIQMLGTPPVATTVTGESTIPLPSLDGSLASSFTLDFAGSVQQNFGGNSNKAPVQNGYGPGSLIGYSVSDGGVITGKYSNDKTQPLGQIALASFSNPEGLSIEGDNTWSSTDKSGQPVIGQAGVGSVGTLLGNMTESSNVDMSKELVDMIVAQRFYQSNAQTIKTQDSILQTLVSMR